MRAGRRHPARDTYLRRSSARSGPATVGAAHSWPKEAGAVTSGASWNSTTSSRSRLEAKRRSRTFVCCAASTTDTRPSFSSGRTLCARLPRRTCAQIHKLGPDLVSSRPLSRREVEAAPEVLREAPKRPHAERSEEHTSELQSRTL